MTNLWKVVRQPSPARAWNDLPFEEWQQAFSFNNLMYPLVQQTLVTGGKQQEIHPGYTAFSNQALKRNGIVFACEATRMQLFAEAVFKFRPVRSISPGDLFGSPALQPLEEPWPGQTTQSLLARLMFDVDIAGNAYVFRESSSTFRIPHPEHVTIVLGSQSQRPDFHVGDVDTEIIGYIYRPPGGEIQAIMPEEMAHWFWAPDPIFRFRGMSWMQPVVAEIQADGAATLHKRQFFENGATANMVVTLDADITPEAFNEWVELFDGDHKGALNAYKTIYLAGGADAKVVGADMRQMDFKVTQAHGEVRICNAARIPPIIVGVSEGLDSATYANYGLARRAFADGTLRPLWRGLCGALERIVDVPPGAQLWYDDRDIPFLQEDHKDRAEVQNTQATAIAALVMQGFDPDSVVKAITVGDLTLLSHNGLYSVQLHPPNTPAPAQNGQNGSSNGRQALPLPK